MIKICFVCLGNICRSPMAEFLFKKFINDKKLDMVVTSTDIDEIIKNFSDIIAGAINITLHPGIYS